MTQKGWILGAGSIWLISAVFKHWNGETYQMDFDVFLTMHLSIILVINQLNVQNLVL